MKKIAVSAGIALLVVLVLYVALIKLINADGAKDQLASRIQAATGLEMVVLGSSSASFFPPHITIQEVALKNVTGGLSPYFMTARKIEMFFPFSSMFDKEKAIDKMVLSDAQLIIEEMRHGERNIDKLILPATASGQSVPIEFNLNNSSVKYISAKTETMLGEELGGHLLIKGDQFDVDLEGKYQNKPVSFTFHPTSQGNVKMLLKNGGGGTFLYEGLLTTKPFSLKGKFDFNTEDLMEIFSIFDSTITSSPDRKLTFKSSGTVGWDEQNFNLSDTKLEGNIFNGDASLVVQKKSDTWTGQGATQFSLVDVDKMLDAGLMRFFTGLATKASADVVTTEGKKRGGLFPDIDIALALSIKSLMANHQTLSDVDISSSISSGDVVIEQATAKLPGGNDVTTVGLLKNAYQGLTFEGTVDVSGLDFTAAAPVFSIPTDLLPKEDFKRFHGKGNIVISPKEAQITEAVMQIENMKLFGTSIISFQEPFTVDAALNLKGLNADNLLAQVKPDDWIPKNNDHDVSPSPLMKWVNNLGAVYRIKGAIDQYTFLKKPREKLDFALELTKGKLDVRQFGTRFDGVTLTGGVQIDVTKNKPLLALKLISDQMDFNQFFGVPVTDIKIESAGDSRWSKDEFTMQAFTLMDGTFDLACGNIHINNVEYKDFTAKGSLNNSELSVSDFRSILFGAGVRAKGKLVIGKLPSLALAFSLGDIAAEQLNIVLPLFHGMLGRFNLTGTISTSGINMYSWVSNSMGSLTIEGKDIVVKGFNLPGIISSLSAVRTTADIVNVIRLAFPGGDTQISTVKGSYNLTLGTLDTPGIEVSTPAAGGQLSGKLNLVDWNMNNSLSFRMESLDQAKPPILTLLITGSIDEPKLGLDTRSLEEYVALKTRDKLLQSTP